MTTTVRKASDTGMENFFFRPILKRWAKTADFAREVGAPDKAVREWLRIDSIPAAWFAAVVRAALVRGFIDITYELLASRAEARRLHIAAEAMAAARSEIA